MRTAARLTGLLVFLLICRHLHAQMPDIRYVRINEIEALDAPILNCVYKDRTGFLWFGSMNGLYRWDGYRQRSYINDPDDSTSITDNLIQAIHFEDSLDNMWISTVASGLCIYNPKTESFKKFLLRNDETTNIFLYHITRAGLIDNHLIYAISLSKLLLIDLDQQTSKIFLYNESSPDDGSNYINDVCTYNNDSMLWVGTNRGIYQFDIYKQQYYFPELDSGFIQAIRNLRITSIASDPFGTLYIGSTQGLFAYDLSTNHFEIYRHEQGNLQSISSDHIKDIIVSPFNNAKSVWVFTSQGIDRVDNENSRVTHYYSEHNRQPIKLSSFMNSEGFKIIDNTGRLWVATENLGGIMIDLNEYPYRHKIITDEYGHDLPCGATCFLIDKHDGLWVGTGLEGLFHYDKSLKLIKIYKHNPSNINSLSNDHIFSLYEDKDESIWVGTNNGLNNINLSTGKIKSYITEPLPDGLPYVRVPSIFRDSKGILWAGTSQGAYYLSESPNGSRTFQLFDLLPSVYPLFIQIFEDQNGNVWFVTPNVFGLFCLQRVDGEDKVTQYSSFFNNQPNDFNLDGAFCVHEDREHIFWIGTDAGLFRWEPGPTPPEAFEIGSDLQINTIYWIETDSHNNLWLSTEKGIVRFDPYLNKKNNYKILTVKDGLPFEKIYPWQFWKSQTGSLYIGGRLGTGDGYFRFDPLEIKNNDNVPPLVITDFMVRNRSYRLDSSIVYTRRISLRSWENFFSFEFAALDFSNPELNRYSYKLEGYDDAWVEAGSRHYANYTGVPPGNYFFRVKGSNNDGYWNEQGASIAVTIIPPPWRTWWAYIIYTLAILAILTTVLTYKRKRLALKQELLFEQIEKKKLSELDQLRARFFTNISHEFRTPLSLIIAPADDLLDRIRDAKAKKNLQVIKRNALQLEHLIDQVMSLSLLESGQLKLTLIETEMVSYLRGLVQFFESLAFKRGIQLSFEPDGEAIMAFIDREQLQLIMNNLLSNAFKFTPNRGVIRVGLRSEDNPEDKQLVEISIEDTGIGIEPEELDKIFERYYRDKKSQGGEYQGSGIGLHITRELVELHGGTIKVESSPGKGSRFIVRLPAKPHEAFSGVLKYGHEKVGTSKKTLAVHTGIEDEVALAESGSTSNERPLILLIEDNSELRNFMRSSLHNKYRILEAGNGKSGLKRSTEYLPDLVICDIMMPVMDGISYCRALKENELTNHIPVILLTAKASKGSRIEGLESGADDFITKPFDFKELVVRIENLIRTRRKLYDKLLVGTRDQLVAEADPGIMGARRFLLTARAVVMENISDPDFSVEKFGRELSMSRVQLHRKMKALVNQPATEFIRDIRLEKAAELLRSGDMNVAQVAYDVGFNHLSYFAKCFRDKYGKSPSQFQPRGKM